MFNFLFKAIGALGAGQMGSAKFALILVVVFVASCAVSAAFLQPSNVARSKTLRLTQRVTKDHTDKASTASSPRIIDSYVERELVRAQALQAAHKYLEAQALYESLLQNDELVEMHDPLRIAIHQHYAGLLNTLGRMQEAQEVLERSKKINLRREKDRHPARAHIS